jgi:hypothetical protein
MPRNLVLRVCADVFVARVSDKNKTKNIKKTMAINYKIIMI